MLARTFALVACTVVILAACGGDEEEPTPGPMAGAPSPLTPVGQVPSPVQTQPRCGDGKRDATEMCEPNDLAGATCASLGFSGGILNCNPTTCSYDTLMCRMTGTAGSGGSSGGAGTSGGTAGSGT